jgi:enoyl-CoA hydratase/carnithine racemase
MYEKMTGALSAASSNPAILAAVFSSSSAAFSAGADLNEPPPADTIDVPGSFMDTSVGHFMSRVATFDKVLVAVVRGAAVGVGATLLAHCDFVYASETAYVWTPFARSALVPEFASTLLFPLLMGHQRAARLLLSSEKFSAHEAKEANLVTEVFADDKLDAAAAARVAATLSALGGDHAMALKTVRLFKTMLLKPRQQAVMDLIRSEGDEFNRRFYEGDPIRAVAAWRSKL